MDDRADLAALRAGEDIPLLENVKQLWASPTLRVMSFSGALSALCGYGMNMWMPSFLERVHDLRPADYRLLLGACLGIGGGLGAMLGGVITAKAAARDPRAFLYLPALTMVIFAAALLLAVWTASLPVAYAAIFVAAFTQAIVQHAQTAP